MSVYIRTVALFVIITLLLDLFIGFLFHTSLKYVRSGDLYKINYALNESQDSIVIFGASEVSHHFISQLIEDKTGLKTFNFGIDGHGIYFQYAIINEFLKRNTPKTVILSTSGFYDGKKNIGSLLPYVNNYQDIKSMVYHLDKTQAYFDKLNAFRFNSMALDVLTDIIRPNDNFKGFEPILSDTTKFNSFKKEYVRCIEKGEAFFQYEKLLKLISSYHVENIIIVNTPKYVIDTCSNNYKLIEQLANKYNAEFMDYSSDPVFLEHPSLFKDPGHLNQKGAEVFTQKFILSYLKHINK